MGAWLSPSMGKGYGGETERAVQEFKGFKKDILLAMDVASKGLDFPEIQHVINYDMPEDIENYVHMIGRGKTRGPPP